MNISNESNTTEPGIYLTEDQWLTTFGSTLPLDIFMSYPYLITGFLGLVLNAYSFIVFQDAEFKVPLYKCLRVYCINNMIVCLFGSFNCFSNTKRVFSWSNSYLTNAYAANFYVPLAATLNFFSSMIDIFTVLDRIGNFNRRVKTIFHYPMYRTCFITFIACSAFSVPLFLAYGPESQTVMLNSTSSLTIWYPGASPYFSMKLIGTVWLAIILAVKDFVTMVVQLVLNIISIILLKRYVEKKIQLTSRNGLASSKNRVTPMTATTSTQEANTANGSKTNSKVSAASRWKVGLLKNKNTKPRVSSADQRATVSFLLKL
jgi:hypothetical protein